jgi:hypothetical protein
MAGTILVAKRDSPQRGEQTQRVDLVSSNVVIGFFWTRGKKLHACGKTICALWTLDQFLCTPGHIRSGPMGGTILVAKRVSRNAVSKRKEHLPL